MAISIQDIPASEALATSRAKLNSNFAALNDGKQDLMANASILSKLSESGGLPLYNGNPIGTSGFGRVTHNATGSFSSGDPMAIRGDATVERVTASIASVGTSAKNTIRSVAIDVVDMLYAWHPTGNYGLLIWRESNIVKGAVVTESGSGPVLGTVTASSMNSVNFLLQSSLVYDSNSGNFLLHCNYGASGAPVALVISVSAGTVTFNTSVNAGISGTNYSRLVQYSAGVFLVVFTESGTSGSYGTYTGLLTVSGTSVTYSGQQTLYTNGATNNAVVTDFSVVKGAGTSYLFLFRDPVYNSGQWLRGIPFSVASNGVLTIGSSFAVFSKWGAVFYIRATGDGTGKFLATCLDSRAFPTIIAGSFTSTTVTAGADQQLRLSATTALNWNTQPIYLRTANGQQEYIVPLNDQNYGGGQSIYKATVRGTTVLTGPIVSVFTDTSSNYSVLGKISDGTKFVWITKATSSYIYGACTSGEPAYPVTNFPYFIGLAENTGTNGQACTCTICGGINPSMSGLDVGAVYYLNIDGTLSTSPGDFSKKVGYAKSATELVINFL